MWWINQYKPILELISGYFSSTGKKLIILLIPYDTLFIYLFFIVFVVCHALHLSCRFVSFSLQHLNYLLVFLSSPFWQVLFSRWPITRCCQIPGSWWWCWLGVAPGIIIFYNQDLHALIKFLMSPITIICLDMSICKCSTKVITLTHSLSVASSLLPITFYKIVIVVVGNAESWLPKTAYRRGCTQASVHDWCGSLSCRY